jgi:uncharacterized protein (DUF1501 family)
MKRRSFLQGLAAAPIALGIPRAFAATAPASSRLTILVNLEGGNDSYNTWVPYTDPLYYKLRPTIAIPADQVLKVTDKQGFHPALAPLMPLWESQQLALVQGIGMPDINQQHYRDVELVYTASEPDEYLTSGWMTRALARRPLDDKAIADALAIGELDIRALDPYGPFRGGTKRVVQVHHASELLGFRELSKCATDINPPGKASLAGRNVTIPPVALKTAFPAEPFGTAIRAAVEVAAYDRTLPVIHLTLNATSRDHHHAFDTHWEQLKYHGTALERFAKGMVALKAGLEEIGRWDETLVMTYAEFGRSPVENEDKGTHHGHAATQFVLGGRVKGGLYGEAIKPIKLFAIGGPPPVIDYRELYTTVIERWWGADASGVFARRYKPVELLRA